MNKKIIVLAFWFVVAVAGCLIPFFSMKLSWKGKMKLPAPRPDVIATSTAPNKTVFIENKTAGYTITVPWNWYLEKSAGSGMIVYPNYDATSKTPPDCKIEISALSNPGREVLADWLTAYFHEDPTADVSKISRTATTIGGASAIVWSGMLNSVFSTLAYVATSTMVYEIAPSAIAASGDGAPIGADCESALRTVFNNFQFAK